MAERDRTVEVAFDGAGIKWSSFWLAVQARRLRHNFRSEYLPCRVQ